MDWWIVGWLDWWSDGLMGNPTGQMQHSSYPIGPIRNLVEPEVVATSPYPIKSRVPVCCGFGSVRVTGDE